MRLKYALALSPILLTACSIKPVATSSIEREQRAQSDLQELSKARAPIKKKLGLSRAIARSLKYNLDARVKLLEEVIAHTDMQATSYNMLPNLVASAGYLDRNNVNAVLSPTTGLVSTAEDPVRRLADLRFSWNLLDFGVSYFESKQKADQVMIAEEKRRKMLQRLALDTKSAFWFAYANQKYNYRAMGLHNDLYDAIDKSRQAQSEKLLTPLEAARYRRELWTIINKIDELKLDLSGTKARLMNLVYAPARARVRLITSKSEHRLLPKHFPKRLRQLEKIALLNRPEIREEDYRKRMSLDEINKARLRLLPGFELNYGGYYDSNSFLVNNNWNQLGLTLTWNILKLFHNMKNVDLAEQQSSLTDLRRLALSMAIITQVDIAKLRYDKTRELAYSRAKVLLNDQEIHDTIAAKKKEKFDNQMNLTKARAALLHSQLEYDIAYAEMYVAAALLLESVGYDPIRDIEDTQKPLNALTMEVKRALKTNIHLARSSRLKQLAKSDTQTSHPSSKSLSKTKGLLASAGPRGKAAGRKDEQAAVSRIAQIPGKNARG